MFKKKLFLSGKNTPTYFKLLRVLVLFCLIIFVSYGLVFTYGIIAQSNPVNDPFYCVYSPTRWNYIIPCVWLRDTGQTIVSASNSRKYYPNSGLSETISYINSQNLPEVTLRANLVSECRYIKRPASEYNATITNQSFIDFCARDKDSCLSDLPSGFFLHNLDLVKARFSSNSEIVTSANSIQQLISDLNCDDLPTVQLLTSLRDIHSKDLNLSRMTEEMPSIFNPPPSPPAPSPVIGPVINPQFCVYTQSGSAFELPCTYFSTLGLPLTPSTSPGSYKGHVRFDEFLNSIDSPVFPIDRKLAAFYFCQELKTPISEFNSKVSLINRSYSDSTEKYRMIPEFFRKGIYLHILQEIASRPQSSQTNALLVELSGSISSFNCNQPEGEVLDAIRVWESKDKELARLTSQGAPVYGVPVDIKPYDPLFCTHTYRDSENKPVTSIILCDYVRRLGLRPVLAISQVYQGNLVLSSAYDELLQVGSRSFRENLVRDACRYLKVEPQEFDNIFRGSPTILDVIPRQNFFHTISLVAQNIENSSPLFGSRQNQIPTNQGLNDTRVIDFREDTALLDTAVDIKKSKVSSNIESMSRETILSELESKFKLNTQRFSNFTIDQLRELLKSMYNEKKEDYNFSTNDVFERVPELNSQVVVNNIIFRTRTNLNCSASIQDLKEEMTKIYQLDQSLSDLSSKKSTDNSNKLKDIKSIFNINF